MLPLDLILVRHGESEGNVANKRSRAGDNRDFTPAFLARHISQLRLSSKGQAQARTAGAWLKANNLDQFDRHYVSQYVRALETAALMDLPNAQWHTDAQLRERDHGLAETLSDAMRAEKFPEHTRLHDVHRFYTPWPDGESVAQVCNRLRNNIVSTLHRAITNQRVIIVSHGDVMRAFRVIFERISADTYHAVDQADEPWFKIGNCQIVHYTRIDPTDQTRILPYLGWVRSVNPYDPGFAGHDWRPIVRQTYTNAELLALAERSRRLVDS